MMLSFTRGAAGVAWLLLLLVGLRPAARAQAPTPAWDWAARGASAGAPSAYSNSFLVQTDAAGNTYLAAGFSHQLTLGTATLATGNLTAGLVTKLSPTGAVLWTRTFTSPLSMVAADRLALDGAGNVYLAGTFRNSLTLGSLTLTDPFAEPTVYSPYNGFVAKLDAQGTPQWAVRVGARSNAGVKLGTCSGLAVDAAGQLAVGGYYSADAELAGQPLPVAAAAGYSFYVARLDQPAAGPPTVRWVRTAPGLRLTGPVALGLTPAGEVYAGLGLPNAATFGSLALPGIAGSATTALVKYDAAGTEQWARQLPALLPAAAQVPSCFPYALVSTATHVALLAAEFAGGSGTRLGTRLAQFTSQGAPAWDKTLISNHSYTGVSDLAADAAGNLYLCGGVLDNVTYDGLTLASTTPATNDGCLWSFTAQGVRRWGVVATRGPGFEYLGGLAVAGPDQLQVVGFAEGAAQLGPFALAASGLTSELLVGQLRISPTTATQPAAAATFTLSPNPAHAFATLTLPAAPAARAFALLDALGRPVRHYTVPAGATTARLEVAGLPAGLYVLHGAGASRKLVLE